MGLSSSTKPNRCAMVRYRVMSSCDVPIGAASDLFVKLLRDEVIVRLVSSIEPQRITAKATAMMTAAVVFRFIGVLSCRSEFFGIRSRSNIVCFGAALVAGNELWEQILTVGRFCRVLMGYQARGPFRDKDFG